MRETGKLVVSGKQDNSQALYLFSPRGVSLCEQKIQKPCKCHCADSLLCLQIAGKEWLTMSCSDCENITLMDVNREKVEEKQAISGNKFYRMCHGEINKIYVTLLRNEKVLELDCSNIKFEQVNELDLRTNTPNDICYVSSRKSLVVTDSYGREVRLISCTNNDVLAEIDRKVQGIGPVLFLPRHKKILLGDADKIRILDPQECLKEEKSIELPEMGSIFFLCLFNGQITMIHKSDFSFNAAYLSLK